MCSATSCTGTALRTASRDKNVVGFDPYMVPTYKDRDLTEGGCTLERAKAPTEAAAHEQTLKRKKPICTIWITQVCRWLDVVQADGSLPEGH